MYRDLYLKFNTEQEANSVLYEAFENPEDNTKVLLRPKFRNIDIIGLVYKPTGQMTLMNEVQVPEMAALPGWHVNVRLMPEEDDTELIPFVITPSTPMRVWA